MTEAHAVGFKRVDGVQSDAARLVWILDQLALHRRRPGIQTVRPVEGDGEDAGGDLVADLLEVHVVS